jgi:hypothetical protein
MNNIIYLNSLILSDNGRVSAKLRDAAPTLSLSKVQHA